MADEPKKEDILQDPKETDNPQKPTPPSDPQGGQGTKEGEELPEKFKGKSAAEIAKSFIELEKEFGKHSNELGTSKKQLEQFYALANVINSNPELKASVLKAIDKQSGEKETDSDDGKKPQKSDDTTITVRNDIVSTFRKELGINLLSEDERKPLLDKIMNELSDFVDPDRTLTSQGVLDKIPLQMLRKYLDKAYRLATVDNEKEQSRVKGLLEARKNQEAVWGSINSSGVKQQRELTPKQKETARRMGISEEKYLKNLLELEQE